MIYIGSCETCSSLMDGNTTDGTELLTNYGANLCNVFISFRWSSVLAPEAGLCITDPLNGERMSMSCSCALVATCYRIIVTTTAITHILRTMFWSSQHPTRSFQLPLWSCSVIVVFGSNIKRSVDEDSRNRVTEWDVYLIFGPQG